MTQQLEPELQEDKYVLSGVPKTQSLLIPSGGDEITKVGDELREKKMKISKYFEIFHFSLNSSPNFVQIT